MSKAQLTAELNAANIAPDVSKDLLEVVSIPEIRTLLSQMSPAA